MPFLWLAIIAIGAFVIVKPSYGSVVASLPDVDPENQGGDWDTQYDEMFSAAGSAVGLPFALLKAIAIRESNLNPKAYHYDNPKAGASYGLMQVEWNKGQNTLKVWGLTDDEIGDGAILYDPWTSTSLGAKIINDNLKRFGNLRDAINAYNTGVKESKRAAPNNYVNDIIANYSKLVGRSVT